MYIFFMKVSCGIKIFGSSQGANDQIQYRDVMNRVYLRGQLNFTIPVKDFFT